MLREKQQRIVLLQYSNDEAKSLHARQRGIGRVQLYPNQERERKTICYCWAIPKGYGVGTHVHKPKRHRWFLDWIGHSS